MTNSVRLWALLLGALSLFSLACAAPALPVLGRAEPTSTPRPTRTSRPTFTPTPSDTPTPPFTPTPTRTNTPTVTNTPVPPTATNTPVPPTKTNTPRPIPPTATRTHTPVPPPAAPTNTPAPVFQYSVSLGDTSRSSNCLTTAINGQIIDGSGNPFAGVTMHVSGDGWPGANDVSTNSFQNSDQPTKRNAQVIVGAGFARPGKWYVSVIDDAGTRISNELTVYTDGDSDEKSCGIPTFKGGGIQIVPVIIKHN